MRKVRWVPATAGAALVAAMVALPGAGTAYALDNGNTAGNGNVPVLSGNSITAPVSVPVNLGTSPSSLPTTGADLLLLGVAALGSIGVGAGAVAVARRRRNSEV